MYKTILAAVDLSELSEVVFRQALELSKFCGAKLIVLHVLSSEEDGFPSLATFSYDDFDPVLVENYLERWEQFEQKGLQHLNTFADQAQKEGVKVEVFQNTGNPGKNIREMAHDRAVDLIVMGNRGRSGLSELFLGSQSNYVMHHAPCSVQIVQAPVSRSSCTNAPHGASANLTQVDGD